MLILWFLLLLPLLSVYAEDICESNDPDFTTHCNDVFVDGNIPRGINDTFENPAIEPVVHLCEKGANAAKGKIAVIFDCYYRMPLVAATMLTKEQFGPCKSSRSKKENWKQTPSVEGHQATKQDYNLSSCSEFMPDVTGWTVGTTPRPKWVSVDRGHLIADQYMPEMMKDITYRYINQVPQFGAFNRGLWSNLEADLNEWAQGINKQNEKATCDNLYLLVGAVPSVDTKRFKGENGVHDQDQLWFGKASLSCTRDDDQHHLNVPLMMWAAACCVGENGQTYKGKAFYGTNLPFTKIGGNVADETDISALQELLKYDGDKEIDLFPGTENCKTRTKPIQDTEMRDADPGSRRNTVGAARSDMRDDTRNGRNDRFQGQGGRKRQRQRM